MSLIDILRTTPAKFAFGTVGVAGVSSAVAFKVVGGKATGEEDDKTDADPSDVSALPKDPSSSRYSSSTGKIKTLFDEYMEDWLTGTLLSVGGQDLNLKAFNCSSSFFPGIKWPDFFDPTSSSSKTDANPDLSSSPSKKAEDTSQACLSMHLKRKSNKALFRSELTVKNENVGIAFWTALQDSESVEDAGNGQHNFLFFLEKGETDPWSVKMGYFWIGRPIPPSGAPITIKSPDSSHTFSKVFNSSEGGEIDVIFSGVWTEGEGDDQPLVLKEKEIVLENESYLSPIALSKEVNTLMFGFCKDECVGDPDSFNWTKISSASNEQNKASIKKTVSAWYDPFKNKKGKWQKLEEYCKTQTEISEDEKANSPCYMSNS